LNPHDLKRSQDP